MFLSYRGSGVAQTTFMNLLSGDLVPSTGESRRSHKLRIGRYAQVGRICLPCASLCFPCGQAPPTPAAGFAHRSAAGATSSRAKTATLLLPGPVIRSLCSDAARAARAPASCMQHFVDALSFDENPVEYLMNRFPEAGLKPEVS